MEVDGGVDGHVDGGPVVPALELLAHFEVELGEVLDLGDTHLGHRRIVPIVGGRFVGPGLSGAILSGGADWQVVRPDGTADIDTRYTLRTEAGELVSIRTAGVRAGPPEVLAAIAAGAAVDPASYYFRVTVALETGAPRLRWLNDVVAVGSAVRQASRVLHDTYVVR